MPQNLLDWLIGPVLVEFLRTYPDVKLEVLCDSRLVDLVAEGFDVGIRLGERLARDVVAVASVLLPRELAKPQVRFVGA